MADSPDAPPPARKPWPMTWVAVAILAYVVVYTLINVGFRKEERPHEPAAEAIQRKRHFIQATMNGWTRYAVHLALPAPSQTEKHATTMREPAPADLAKAVPVDLTMIFPGKPSMQAAPQTIMVPAVVPADAALRVLLYMKEPEKFPAFGEALAYAKDQHLHLFIQDQARPPVDEPPLPAAPWIELTLPPGVLAAGEWQATLYTKDEIFHWQFSVQP